MIDFLIYYALTSYLVVFVIFFRDICMCNFARKEILILLILFFISPIIVFKVIKNEYFYFKFKKKLNIK